MKKLLSVMILLLLCMSAPAFAMYCNKCGKQVPEDSNFCNWCGNSLVVTVQPSGDAVVLTGKDCSLADYHYVNQLEQVVNAGNYETASREARKLRPQHDRRIVEATNQYAGYSLYGRKLHDLHVKKFNALDNYLDAWRDQERSLNRASARAAMARAQYVLSGTNEAIDALLTGAGSFASIARAEEIEKRVQKNSHTHRVTSKYLVVDNHRLKTDEPLWVIEVAAGHAMVLHMGQGGSSSPVSGWVSVADLEKRSTWRYDASLYPQSPGTVVYKKLPAPPVRVVIVDDSYYRWRFGFSSGWPRYRSHRSYRPIRHRPPHFSSPHSRPPRRR
ncbi:MAG: hypothetical protein CVV42_12195 [Candidatus Riflebacteria bacterium HGW-Riflebacteria-2]|nr:MAG: hypothetical protein CVV42_12195 [Candidatus Riflebacteria bacterium HGW-Riflebacteria-2]